jgi:succinoglycan biosynthesis transport protein ExoP
VTTNTTLAASRFSESSIHLSDILRILRKYGIYFLGLMILGGTLGAIWAKFQTPQYDAVAMVHMDQHSSISLGALGGDSGDQYDLKMQTQIIGLTSRNLAERTITKIDPSKHPLFGSLGPHTMDTPQARDAMVNEFLGSLKVAQVPKSELLSVTFRSTSPALAASVANTLVDEYLAQSIEQRVTSTGRITTYLDGRTDDLRNKIQKEQSDLLNAEAKLGILSQGSSSDSSLLLNETTQLLSQRVKTQGDRYLAEAEYQNMSQHPDATVPVDIPAAAGLTAMESQLATAESQVAVLSDRYGPNYPPLQQAQAQVDSLKKSLASQRQSVLNGARENMERAEKAEQSINDRLDALQKESEGRTPDLVRYEILKAKYTSDQTLYNVLISALATGSIQAGLQAQELNLFTPAEIPGVRSYPKVRVVTSAGAAFGLVISLIFVGIIVLNSDTVQTVEQVEEALPLPVLASVPEYKEDLAAMRMSDDVLPLVTLLAPRSAGTEAYRLLRTSISLMPVSQKHRVISLTSCGPGEGKSTTSLNLAVVLATQSKRVLLIDADLRKPTIAQRLKMPASDQPGLSRFLSDQTIAPEECIQRVADVAGLDVIPVQEIPPFPSELLGQGRLEELLAWARDHYDYVLIDTPPVLLVTDALIIATHCDTLLVVVRIGVAQKRALRRIRQDLAKYPGKQTGVVINALPHADTYYGGYGNYRKYYGKGYGNEGGYYGSGSEGGYFSKTKD